MIGRNGERRSGISAQTARHDDDDDTSFKTADSLTVNTNQKATIAYCTYVGRPILQIQVEPLKI